MTALTGGVSSIVGGILQRRAADKAAKQQAAAAAAAKGEVLAAGNDAAAGVTGVATRGRDAITGSMTGLDPYEWAGTQAAGAAHQLTTNSPVEKFSFDPSTIGMDPAYQFRVKQANKAMLQNGAAFGDLQSGGFATKFQEQNQDMASAEADKIYGRQRDTFNANQDAGNSRVQQLLAMMGLGKSATDSRIGGTTDASQIDLTGANMAGLFKTDAAGKGADLTTRTGDTSAVGTYNKSNATQGMLGNLASIDWGSLFKAKTPAPAIGKKMASLPLLGFNGMRQFA